MQSEPFQPHRAFVSGRPVTIVGEWDEYPDAGWYYRYDGSNKTHWIRSGNRSLTGTLPRANYSVPALATVAGINAVACD